MSPCSNCDILTDDGALCEDCRRERAGLPAPWPGIYQTASAVRVASLSEALPKVAAGFRANSRLQPATTVNPTGYYLSKNPLRS